MIPVNACCRKASTNIRSHVTDRVVCGLVFLLLFGAAAKANYPVPTYRNQKFAYEYGNIAEALITGQGFSNPFPFETGPTAWMPPLFVYLIATVFKVFGVKSSLSLWVLLGIVFLGMSASLYLLLRMTDQGGYGLLRYSLVPVFVLYVFAHRWYLFRELHDIWLTLLLTCWMLYGLL